MLTSPISIATVSPLPCWRSLLFIPAHKLDFVDSAGKRDADAIILDLEDSVPAAEKPAARKYLGEKIALLTAQSLDIVIRINHDLINAVADLDVAVTEQTQALMIPKVMGADHIRLLDEAILHLEQQRGLLPGKIRLIALIESIEGLCAVNTIAQSSARLCAMALGTEDLSLDGGFDTEPENFILPAQQLIYAARLANIRSYGFPGSIADYSDINKFAQWQVKAKSMGFNGALCIHPSQVEPINQAYTVSTASLANAKKIVAAYEMAIKNKQGVIEVDGKMVDAPVFERAKRIIASAAI
ncbi:MAG: citrate lyase subunit beta/citryl-CoA lyase [Candidatus Endobugula sp.]|jgi:citrate lyase subunit beta/citryl-CoA lyase